MGVYIKSMEMPKEAGKYRIEFDQCGNAYLLSDNDDDGFWHITTVPPHGRLIDADEQIERAWRLNLSTRELIETMLKSAPTIIPAEEGE